MIYQGIESAITAMLLGVVAVCVALTETLQHRFSSSIFRNLNPKFWNPQISWKNKGDGWFNRSVGVIWSDALHLFKFIAMICVAASIFIYRPYSDDIGTRVFEISFFWVWYFLIFQFTYNKLFKA